MNLTLNPEQLKRARLFKLWLKKKRASQTKETTDSSATSAHKPGENPPPR